MNELSIYFEPLDVNWPSGEEGRVRMSDKTQIHTQGNFPDGGNIKVAIIGVNDGRCTGIEEGAADLIREHLYSLHAFSGSLEIVDLGNINRGETIEDTYFAVASTTEYLIKNNIIPVIIGGSQDLTYANYQGYEALEQTINVVQVDPRFDLGDVEGELNEESYLGKIVLHQPNYLFNYTNIGYQRYFVDESLLELMEGLYFDVNRLGEVRADLTSVEPMVRNADMITFDLASVRRSDAPGAMNGSVHGFYGEEACQLMRYAGMSDKLTSLGLYNYDLKLDQRGTTAELIAQMIWHFLEGVTVRKADFPIGHKEDYIKYQVALKDQEDELVFLKSPKSDRWWMEVPYPPSKRVVFERHCLVPCTYGDYETAMKNELPELWLRTYKKLC